MWLVQSRQTLLERISSPKIRKLKKHHTRCSGIHAEFHIYLPLEVYVFETFATAEVKQILLVVYKNDQKKPPKNFFLQAQCHFHSE